jgi:uncharacterized protein (TIGR02145 family)
MDKLVREALIAYLKVGGTYEKEFYELIRLVYLNELIRLKKVDEIFNISPQIRQRHFISGGNYKYVIKEYDFENLPVIIEKSGEIKLGVSFGRDIFVAQIVLRFNSYNGSLNNEEVKIGNQNWKTKNLDVEYFQNGDKIKQAKSFDEWQNYLKNDEPAWCYNDFDNNPPQDCGKIYNWYVVIDKRIVAPIGWHIPSSSEWDSLRIEIGIRGNGTLYAPDAGDHSSCTKKIRSKSRWPYSGSGHMPTNELGFSGLPCGILYHNGYGESSFPDSDNENIRFWSTTRSSSEGYGETIRLNEWMLAFEKNNLGSGLYIRCIKDE